MKIVFPELETNMVAKAAAERFPDIEWVDAPDLDTAAEMVARGGADSMISGLDFASRDVLIAYKNHIPMESEYFSSSFIGKRQNLFSGEDEYVVLADGGVNKMPTKEQLYTVVEDTARNFVAYFGEQPKIAMLSYSTYGSGGRNPDLEKIDFVMREIKAVHPDWVIDGEMQLDAAVSPEVAEKKTPNSPLRGAANILITPELNSGNILYKALERFGGFVMAGPIIQGFRMPLADLLRGSTVEDTALTIDVIKKLIERKI